MKMGLDDISKRIKLNLIDTHEKLKEHKEVSPKTLQQLVQDIGKLKESSEITANIPRADIDTNIEEAIESLTAIELMIEKMKGTESDILMQNIQKVVAQELEEMSRDEVASLNFSLEFFNEKKIDLKKFLNSKQKIEKIYKSKPQ